MGRKLTPLDRFCRTYPRLYDVWWSIMNNRVTWFNWLPREYRYVGLIETWYDGPIYSFGFWFFNVGCF